MSYSMGAYPPGTWEGDPRAPWNQEDEPTCGSCVRFAPILAGTTGVCLRRLRHYADMASFEAIDASGVDCDSSCDEWRG